MKKLGVLGGAFDPIHAGHLHLARVCYQKLGLDKVLFIPSAVSPFKEGKTSSFSQRLTMTAIATAEIPYFEVSAVEALREGKSYTCETLKVLKEIYAGWELYFLSGADALESLSRWYNWQEILANCYFVGVNRPGYELKIDEALNSFPQAKEKIILLKAEEEIDISSRLLRSEIQSDLKNEYLPTKVWEYIKEQGLYRR